VPGEHCHFWLGASDENMSEVHGGPPSSETTYENASEGNDQGNAPGRRQGEKRGTGRNEARSRGYTFKSAVVVVLASPPRKSLRGPAGLLLSSVPSAILSFVSSAAMTSDGGATAFCSL